MIIVKIVKSFWDFTLLVYTKFKKRIGRNLMNIVITGSSSGIGKALKDFYKAQGHNVVGISRSNDDFLCDVAKKQELEKVFCQIKNQFGKIDILINNAGFGLSGAIELTEEEQLRQEFDVNVIGATFVLQLAIPLMSKNGKIINISSACALFPLPFRAFYCSSKAALSMLSDCLRMELCKTKIQVTAICPCDIKTEFTKNRVKNFETNERYGNSIKLSAEKIDNAQDKRMPLDKAIKILTKIIAKKRLKPQYVMGMRNKLLYQVQKFFPKSMVLKVLTKMFYKTEKKHID